MVKIPHASLWSWRKLLKLSNIAKHFIRFQVGDGNHIYLWLDLWHPIGMLLEQYGNQAIYDAGSQLNAKVSSVLCDKSWISPPANQILSSKSKAKWIMTSLSGLYLTKVPTIVLMHGHLFEPSNSLLIGGG